MRLRPVEDSDLDTLFEYQADPEAYLLADVPSRDRVAFDAHWARLRGDPEVVLMAIDVEGQVAGHVLSFPLDGERKAGYWLGRDYWGRGIAGAALAAFLEVETRRPLHANVALANPASVRVLEKNGFTLVRQDANGFAFVLR